MKTEPTTRWVMPDAGVQEVDGWIVAAHKHRKPVIGVGEHARKQTFEAHVVPLLDALAEDSYMGKGECWCEVSIGNPMMGGRHSRHCEENRALLALYRPQEPQ